jgi:hypothetical protein
MPLHVFEEIIDQSIDLTLSYISILFLPNSCISAFRHSFLGLDVAQCHILMTSTV